MCVVSMVGDHYRDYFPKKWPNINPPSGIWEPTVSKKDFDALKERVEEMLDLLKKAALYDKLTGQADCQMDEKMDFLRKIAKMVGVDLDAEMAKGGV